jgi:hypothetical protein
VNPLARCAVSIPDINEMNGEEQAFALELAERQQRGDVLWWRYEPAKLRLAKATTYTPDFMVIDAFGLVTMYEVKAWWASAQRVGWQEDARVKIKIAASAHPWARFVAVWRKGRGCPWEQEEFAA